MASVSGFLVWLLLAFVVIPFGLIGLISETIGTRKGDRKLYAERQARKAQRASDAAPTWRNRYR